MTEANDKAFVNEIEQKLRKQFRRAGKAQSMVIRAGLKQVLDILEQCNARGMTLDETIRALKEL